MSISRFGRWPGSPYIYSDYKDGWICVDCSFDKKTRRLKDEDEAFRHLEEHKAIEPTEKEIRRHNKLCTATGLTEFIYESEDKR